MAVGNQFLAVVIVRRTDQMGADDLVLAWVLLLGVLLDEDLLVDGTHHLDGLAGQHQRRWSVMEDTWLNDFLAGTVDEDGSGLDDQRAFFGHNNVTGLGVHNDWFQIVDENVSLGSFARGAVAAGQFFGTGRPQTG